MKLLWILLLFILPVVAGCSATDGLTLQGSSGGLASSGEPIYLTFGGRAGTEADAQAYIKANNQPATLDAFKVVALPRVGGLHHRYARAA